MPKTVTAGEPQSDECQNKLLDPIITPGLGAAQRVLNLGPKPDGPEVPAEKLQARKTREFVARELDLKISVDSTVDLVVF